MATSPHAAIALAAPPPQFQAPPPGTWRLSTVELQVTLPLAACGHPHQLSAAAAKMQRCCVSTAAQSPARHMIMLRSRYHHLLEHHTRKHRKSSHPGRHAMPSDALYTPAPTHRSPFWRAGPAARPAPDIAQHKTRPKRRDGLRSGTAASLSVANHEQRMPAALPYQSLAWQLCHLIALRDPAVERRAPLLPRRLRLRLAGIAPNAFTAMPVDLRPSLQRTPEPGYRLQATPLQ